MATVSVWVHTMIFHYICSNEGRLIHWDRTGIMPPTSFQVGAKYVVHKPENVESRLIPDEGILTVIAIEGNRVLFCYPDKRGDSERSGVNLWGTCYTTTVKLSKLYGHTTFDVDWLIWTVWGNKTTDGRQAMLKCSSENKIETVPAEDDEPPVSRIGFGNPGDEWDEMYGNVGMNNIFVLTEAYSVHRIDYDAWLNVKKARNPKPGNGYNAGVLRVIGWNPKRTLLVEFMGQKIETKIKTTYEPNDYTCTSEQYIYFIVNDVFYMCFSTGRLTAEAAAKITAAALDRSRLAAKSQLVF